MEAFKAKKLPLHVLVNNAGLQAPYDDTTDEGFEVFAFTAVPRPGALVCETFATAADGRVQRVSSGLGVRHVRLVCWDPDLSASYAGTGRASDWQSSEPGRIAVWYPLTSAVCAQITVGVNYFGAFYLTQLLLDTLKASQPSRVVWVSSPEESLGTIDWDDLQCVPTLCHCARITFLTEVPVFGTVDCCCHAHQNATTNHRRPSQTTRRGVRWQKSIM